MPEWPKEALSQEWSAWNMPYASCTQRSRHMCLERKRLLSENGILAELAKVEPKSPHWFLEIIRLQMTLPHPTFCCLWSGTGLHCLFPVWALCVQCKHFMSCPAWSIRLSGRCPPTLKKAAIRMEMVNAACLMVGRYSEAHYGHTIHSLNSLYAPWVLLRRVH